MVLREGGDRFLHLFGAGFAHYVWTVFVDAAQHLGGRAVGVTALGAATSTEEVAHAWTCSGGAACGAARRT